MEYFVTASEPCFLFVILYLILQTAQAHVMHVYYLKTGFTQISLRKIFHVYGKGQCGVY